MLVERLGDERVWCLDGDEVVAPEALPQLVALGAAAVPALLAATAGDDDWVRLRAVDALGRIGEAPAVSVDEVRQEFREHVLTLAALWPYGTAWDWARPRLVGVAGVLGDARLLPVLAEFLHYPDQPESAPTRAAVCDALAAVTGVDLRRDTDGQPRTSDALVQAWRDWLQKR
ncbi:MAG: hypothetical protein H6835_12585 [Planctomycetes bacterium]|nr:hypothetical protein [Planctomycetota bacterium]